MKISIILFCILILQVVTDDVKPADDACTCPQLLSENDCKAKSGCIWTAGTPAQGITLATQGSCAGTTQIPTINPTYCSTIINPAIKCASTTGCAYLNSKCTHFTGCTAYVKTTNAECQAISTLCITDGTQCTDAKSCNEYTTQTVCEATPSISGNKKCKWDNGACRDYICTEAAYTLTTNADCSDWLTGCITTGKGCTLTLGACAAYTGDDVACGGLQGTDGNCEGVANGTNCKARTCAGAANTLTTNTDCAAYQIGCVTNGKGCEASPLPACASYSGDNKTCVGYIGSDGICEGDVGAANCRARICTNAHTYNDTDTLCADYKAGCVTTGKGCITTRRACSSYSGTTTSCVGYIGSDGYCKGTYATTASPCAPKVCTEAPTTTNTDAACASYQTGCVTTGKGCVSSLGLCSGYTGTTTTCDGYIGTDGKCKGTNYTNPDAACAPKVCTDAPASIKTNQACAQFQNGCVTNGAGCVNQTSCINTIKQVSCTGTSGCGWNSICVASNNCSDFLTASICSGNNAGGKPCYWTGSACRDLVCSDAPTNHNTDALCNIFLAGCVTKADGCLSLTDGCNQYKGDLGRCAQFTRNCWNTSTATAMTPCAERTCADDTTSTSDNICGKFKTGCRTKGTGCIDPASLCTAYQGTQSQCGAFRGSNGTIRCWNTSSASATTTCTVKACTDNTTATKDTECDTFLDGCVTNGRGCINKTLGCTSYQGTQTTCATFKGTNGTKICWNATTATDATPCKEKECSDAPTDTECGTFLDGCVTNGRGCINKTLGCTSYQGTQTTCATFKGTNGTKICWNATTATDATPCKEKECSDAPTDTECDTFLDGCVTNGRGCINKTLGCTSYQGTQTTCATFKGTNGTKICWNATTATDATPCKEKECSDAPTSLATDTDCGNFLQGCLTSGQGCISPSSACSSYTGTITQCSMFTGNNKKCYKSDSCADRLCTDKPTATNNTECTNYLSTCIYFKGACVNAGTCISYGGSSLAECQDVLDNSITPLKCWWTSGTTCIARICANAPNTVASQADCNNHVAGCVYNGNNQCIVQGTCGSYTAAGADDTARENNCKVMTDTLRNYCWFNAGATSCTDRTCANVPTSPAISGQSTCDAYKPGCQYNGNAACVNQGACNSYTVSGSHDEMLAKCQAMKNTSGKTCFWTTGTTCEDVTCANVPNPTSNTNCSNWLSTCVYTGAGCVAKAASCASYTVTGADNNIKRTICIGLTTTATVYNGCVYVDSMDTCADKTCSNVYPTTVTKATCETWLTSCRYVGTTCQAAAACITITIIGTTDAEKATFCSGIKDNSATPIACIYHSTTSATQCQARTCANIPTPPATDTDCTNHLSTCKLSNTATASCVDVTTACNGYQGTAAQCKTFTGASGTKPCWSTSKLITPAACIDRACTHNTTATTDIECNEFLSGCKTNGAGCVASNTACSTFMGNSSSCVIRKAADNTNYCKYGASVSGSCQDKSCYDNVLSTTDAQCKSFMANCLTRGTGCIPNTEPCASYRGTQTTCAAFTGSSGANKCWNTSAATTTTACANKKCSDDTTSTTDAACSASLEGCVTKGTGCIEKTAACSAYTGTQTTCFDFKGNSGTVPCWNIATATATTACIEKACTHNTTATTDADCDTFLPKASGSTVPRCVTDGLGCETYPRSCSQFTGTTDQCSKFTANDGPCKSTVTTGSDTCTPRICTEALNTNNTDALCRAYHPSCVTTGYGCATSVSCSDIQGEIACTDKTGCSWVNNCRSVGFDCAALTSFGASICVNTPVTTGLKKCAWYNSVCRAVTCEDLSDGLKTDDACKAQLSTCTTKGKGCITKGACSTYSTETICKAAKTTDVGDTCIWDSNACRAKKCTDATTGTTTDDGCNTFLAGCITNGTTCISAGFNCFFLITNAACQKDGSNKPCLWVNSLCYNYAKCEDITMTTHNACQAISSQCTTDGTKCIAIRTCARTSLQVSCVTGTDGACGWLPANGANAAKCQKFGACTDVVSTDKATCQAYGSTCITDGTFCIATRSCAAYTTQIACEAGGTDGTCIYLSSACRLRECSDATGNNTSSITTHDGCYAFQTKTKCTTNGTSCIALSTCYSYTIEAGCVLGSDGICIWALPVGTTTTTTKSCRFKVCSDFPLTTNTACSTVKTGVGVGTRCVSNGTNCIVKSTCSTYTTKEACNGGGTDGLCAFTPVSTTTPTEGTCKLMSACSDANNDRVACAAKSAVCIWKAENQGTTTTTACNAYDCTTKANGTNCNPVPTYDGLTYSICISSTSGCVLGAGTSLTQASCYKESLGTYTWNASTHVCAACITRTIGVNNGGTSTGSTSGMLINPLFILLALVAMNA